MAGSVLSLPVVVVSVAVCLGAANIASRAAFREVEDGVLWSSRAEGVVAADIADSTPAAAVGIQRGDLLIAINDSPIEDPADVVEMLHAAGRGETLRYTVLRLGSRDVIDVRVAPIPGGPASSTSCSRASAPSRCSSAARCGCAARAIRPRSTSCGWPWPSSACSRSRSAAGWIGSTGCSSGPTTSPSWPCHHSSCTSRWSSPSGRPGAAARPLRPSCSRRQLRAGARARARARGVGVAVPFDRCGAVRADQLRARPDAVPLPGGLLSRGPAGAQPRAAAVRTVTARRQLRWIAWGTAFGAGPFAFGYALPYALGVAPSMPMQLLALPLSLIPLAYASAIVRYRLMDVEVIVKRALVYAAIVAAVVAMYVGLLKVVQRMFVQVDGHERVIAFLARWSPCCSRRPVKDFVQTYARPRVLPRSLRLSPRAGGLCPRPQQ